MAGAIFAAAALAVVVLNVLSPFERALWLAAYLFLVGCCSQVLLGAGQRPPATRRATPWTALALWNLGTATVAAADMASGLVGVAAGSAALMASLVLFLSGARSTGSATTLGARSVEGRYVALILFLAASVVVGTALAAKAQ